MKTSTLPSPATSAANVKRSQAGFTIIELIVVIALLGILSAVALPMFISVTDEAHVAAVEGSGAGLATAIALIKAQVVANGELGMATVNVDGYGDDNIDVNDKGYATGLDDSTTLDDSEDCIELWRGVHQGGAATVATAAEQADYQATFQAPAVCTYVYQAYGDGSMSIKYDASTGNITVDTNRDA